MPQGSIIGPGICNLILDGMEQILDEVKYEVKRHTRIILPVRVKNFLRKNRGEKGITTDHLNPRTNIKYVRYADDIIFFGFHNVEIFEQVRINVKSFLEYRGLYIKEKIDNVFLFKPGSQFTYLSYQLIFPTRFNRKLINSGKFTKVRYTP